MGSKFISTSDGDLRAVSDGSLDILGASLGSQNLTPGFPIKINSERKLYSTALVISDVINLQSELDATIQTPFSGTIEATDFKTSSVSSLNTAITEVEKKTQNISTSGIVTNIKGKLEFNSIPVLQITSTRDFTTTGDITCSDLTTNTYPSLNTTLGEYNTSFTVIKAKTQNLTGTASGSSLVGTLSVGGNISAPSCSLGSITAGTTNFGFMSASSASIPGGLTAGNLTTSLGNFNGIVEKTAELNQKIQNVGISPIGATFTSVLGLINVIDMPGDFGTTPGSITCSGNITTSSGNFNDVASRTTTLENKTQNQLATLGITQFSGDLSIGNLFINGNGVNNGFIEGDININGSATFAQDVILTSSSLISFQGNASGTIASDSNKLNGLYTAAINGLTPTGGKYSQTSNDISLSIQVM
jgi:hypothetical protein